jgi:two-component system chemotaxis sensor kinase CheA
VDYGKVTDIVLEGIDFVKGEMAKIDNDMPADGISEKLIHMVKEHLGILKGQTSGKENRVSKEPEKPK